MSSKASNDDKEIEKESHRSHKRRKRRSHSRSRSRSRSRDRHRRRERKRDRDRDRDRDRSKDREHERKSRKKKRHKDKHRDKNEESNEINAPQASNSANQGTSEMIEVILNDRLGKKIRVKCNDDDTVGDLKKLVAVQTGTRPEKIRIQKWYIVYKDHISLADYEMKDGMGLELYYD